MTGNTVIIVAGGSGSRMHSELPKQFLLLRGIPVMIRSIKAFIEFDPDIDIIIGLPENYHEYWKNLCRQYGFSYPYKLSPGGSTRTETVRNALSLVTRKGVVAIHDAVRPLVSQDTIFSAFKTASEKGNAVPCVAVSDSFRVIDGDNSKSFDRSCLRAVQTPQVFSKEVITTAYSSVEGNDYTDDATVVEKTGIRINLTEGNPENIKITRPSDMRLAELLISF